MDEILTMLLGLIGGLGIFLFGINFMGDSLKQLAGNKLKVIIGRATRTPLKSILTGTLVTMLIQSSSGTTALTVSLVSVGFMSLPQAVGVIMGANIGNGITPLLGAFSIGKYSLFIVGVGAVLLFFFPKKKVKLIGQCILGFGLLFYGLELMGDGMKTFVAGDTATKICLSISKNPFLGLSVGTFLTTIIQSSAATINIIQSLYTPELAEGSKLSLMGALPILLGANIGTTITAVIASVGTKVSARRAAFIHVLFNVFGAVLFMCLLYPYNLLLKAIEDSIILPLGGNGAMTLAIAQIVFNLVCTLIMVWFIRYIVLIATKVIRGKEQGDELKELLDVSLIKQSPAFALECVKGAIDKMGDITRKFFNITREYSLENRAELRPLSEEYEFSIDQMNHIIHEYLIKITEIGISDYDSQMLSKYLDTIRDLERIGDHCTNIFEFFDERYSANEILSDEGKNDLSKMFNILTEMLDYALDSLLKGDKDLALKVAEKENLVDRLEVKYRKRHILRLNKRTCGYSLVDNYVDILSNLERVGDHCNNIAGSIISDVYYTEEEQAIEAEEDKE